MSSVIVEQFTPEPTAAPRRPRRRLDATGLVMPWARDAATGHRAEILDRDFSGIAPPARHSEFTVEVTGIRDETPTMHTLVLRRTDGLPFTHRAGQFVRLSVPVDGPGTDPVARCYSVSSSPVLSVYGDPATFTVCVKKVSGGRVSTWIHDSLTTGTVLEAQGPLGNFHLPDVDRRARYLLLAGGAGITPVLSMVRTLAALPGPVDTVVIYHCRHPREFAFAEELLDLDARTPGLTVCLSLGSLTSGTPGWRGATGRLCPEAVAAIVDNACGRRVFACGPPGYLQTAREVSAAVGVPLNAYREESFDETTTSVDTRPCLSAVAPPAVTPTVTVVPDCTAPDREPPAGTTAATDTATTDTAAPGTTTVTFLRSGSVISVAPGETLLDAGRRAGVPLRSNCGAGFCGSCAVRKISGTVDMSDNGGLRQRDIDAGRILLCCSRPAGDPVELDC